MTNSLTGRNSSRPHARDKFNIDNRPRDGEKLGGYHSYVQVLINQGAIQEIFQIGLKNKRSLSSLDLALLKCITAVRSGRGGQFLLHVDDFEAIGSEYDLIAPVTGAEHNELPASDEIKKQNSTIVNVRKGNILSKYMVNDSEHIIPDEVLKSNGSKVMNSLGDPSFHGSWRISNNQYLGLIAGQLDNFNLFRELTFLPEGRVNIGEPVIMDGWVNYEKIVNTNMNAVLRLLEGKKTATEPTSILLRDEDIPVLSEFFPEKIMFRR